jgi:hypothetical protein
MSAAFCSTARVMDSGCGIAPKSLLRRSSFHFPEKSGFIGRSDHDGGGDNEGCQKVFHFGAP